MTLIVVKVKLLLYFFKVYINATLYVITVRIVPKCFIAVLRNIYDTSCMYSKDSDS